MNIVNNIGWYHSGKILQVPPTILPNILQSHNRIADVNKWDQLTEGTELCPVNIPNR